ncbi:MAG: hypothetical protein DI626_03080 [Micavibrio aeruginosavorus]|uniref:Uncharacterized protein n=1 Tax=Micavibrio aeruginosavorus TaxID=349221 RepID=A0A2W5BXR1_9BACT|nr:MAG: hypothetical protein DI626_03080 [Micavibrio aeruginosavorus]
MAAFGLFAFGFYAAPAMAACVNPVGDHGDMLYNRDHTVMQYCNGSDWISMDASHASGAGDNLGDHTATQDLDMASFKVKNAAIPTAAADVTNKAYVDAAVASAAGSGSGNSGGGTCYYSNGGCGQGFSKMPGAFVGGASSNVNHDICCSSGFFAVDTVPNALPTIALSSGPGQYAYSVVSQVTGITSANISISGDGEPQYRICNDSNCTNVSSGWSEATRTINESQYYQVRAKSSTTTGTVLQGLLKIGDEEASIIIDNNALYAFSSHTFTNCAKTGYQGPTLAECRTAYSTVWDENSSYFNITQQGYQTWTVPIGGTYRITARGAAGSAGTGGKGAIMRGEFSLNTNDKLIMVVGQTSETTSYQAGGGTFVTKGTSHTTSTPLIIAGGGGAKYSTAHVNIDATTAQNGQTTCGGAGGTNGAGGAGGTYSGGGGFLTNGTEGNSGYGYGLSFRNGAQGGGGSGCSAFGGFGGGGGGCPGGGGGYSGGGGSASCDGGGGGSYNTGTNQSNSVGNTTHGSILIERVN